LSYLFEEEDVGKEDDGDNVPSHYAAHWLVQDQATTMNGSNKQSRKEKENSENGLVEIESQHVEVMAYYSLVQHLNASVRMLEKLLDQQSMKKEAFGRE